MKRYIYIVWVQIKCEIPKLISFGAVREGNLSSNFASRLSSVLH